MRTRNDILQEIINAFASSTYSNTDKSCFNSTFRYFKYNSLGEDRLQIKTKQELIDSFSERGFLLYALLSNIPENELNRLLESQRIKKALCDEIENNTEVLTLFKPEFILKLLDGLKNRVFIEQMSTFSAIEDFDKITEEQLRVLVKPNNSSDQSYLDIFEKIFGDKVYSAFASLFDFGPINLRGFSNGKKIELLIKALKEVKTESLHNVLKSFPNNLFSIHDLEKLCVEDPRYYTFLDIILKRCYSGFENKAFEQKNCNELFRYACLVAKCCNSRELPAYIQTKLKAVAPLIKLYNFEYAQVIAALKDMYKENNNSLQIKSEKKANKLFAFIDNNGNLQTFNTKEERKMAINKIKESNKEFNPQVFLLTKGE